MNKHPNTKEQQVKEHDMTDCTICEACGHEAELYADPFYYRCKTCGKDLLLLTFDEYDKKVIMKEHDDVRDILKKYPPILEETQGGRCSDGTICFPDIVDRTEDLEKDIINLLHSHRLKIEAEMRERTRKEMKELVNGIIDELIDIAINNEGLRGCITSNQLVEYNKNFFASTHNFINKTTQKNED